MRLHPHIWRYVKTGILFTYSNEEVKAMPPKQQAYAAFAGPIVDAYECRWCGARKSHHAR